MNPFESIEACIRRQLASSKYLRDIVWQMSGSTAAQLLGIASMPLLTRLYTPDDFAALNLFSQTATGLAIFMTLRFEYLVMQPREQSESNCVLQLIFYMGLLHVLWLTPLLATLPAKSDWLRSQGVFADWIWLAPVSAWAISLSVGLQQAVQRQNNFRASGESEFVGRTAYVSCALLGALTLHSIAGLMISTIANAGVKLMWLLRSVPKVARVNLQLGTLRIKATICRMAVFSSLSSFISLFSGMAPMLFISDRYGSGALGQYGLVISTLYLPAMIVSQSIGQVYYQRACQLHGRGLDFLSLLSSTSSTLAKIGIPLYALIALLAPLAYPIVFGAEWQVAGDMARWLCIAAVTGFLSTALDRSSVVVGAWWYLSAWHILRAVMTAACLYASQALDLSIEKCIMLISLQNSFAYGIDWVASYYFASKIPQSNEVPLADSRI